MHDLTCRLAQHEFADLFIEVLGWDHASGSVELAVDGRSFALSVIAQKRGLQVLHAPTDHMTLINRGRLRRLQRKLASLIHEHVVIYSCASPRKQVWQWAIRQEDGRRLRHREHPFFSESPPTPLLKRLKGLQFTLEEEDGVTLVDALSRVRRALDTKAELNLFVHRPQYAEKSDQLAQAMESGGEAEFHEFLLFHRPLVTWAVQPLKYLFQGDIEDAEQTGFLGLVHAARHYQRHRGIQFSTYATYCIRGICKRDAPLWLLPIRVPEHAIWPCLMLQQKLENIAAEGGPSAEAAYLDRLAERDPWLAKEWSQFRVVADIHSLSLRREPEYREARSLADSDGSSVDQLVRSERASIVRETVEQLKPRDTAFIKMKYGFDGEEQTLEAIGSQFGVTRERVRQRLAKVHERLAWKLKFLKERVADTDGQRPSDAEGESDQPKAGCENGLEGDPAESTRHQSATATG